MCLFACTYDHCFFCFRTHFNYLMGQLVAELFAKFSLGLKLGKIHNLMFQENSRIALEIWRMSVKLEFELSLFTNH